MSLDRLDPQTAALLGLAGAVVCAGEPEVEARCNACVAAGVDRQWVDELLLQSTLIVGWPRSLVAFASWRRVSGTGPAEDADDASLDEWEPRGEAVCREVYGKNYQKLRDNVRALHPALEAWMLTEGYGRTMGRPGLDLARRELAVVVQVAIQGAERQLHAHLVGALNAGASAAAVGEALELARPWQGNREAELAMKLWERIRR